MKKGNSLVEVIVIIGAMILISLIFISLNKAGSDIPKPRDMKIGVIDALSPTEKMPSSEWTITFEGEFENPRSYSGFHRIYRITHGDGTVIIGVTGVGTVELGSHRAEKQTIRDER